MAQELVQLQGGIIEIQNEGSVYYSDTQENLQKDFKDFTPLECIYLQYNVSLGNFIVMGADLKKALPTQASLQALIDNVSTIKAAQSERENPTVTTEGTNSESTGVQ